MCAEAERRKQRYAEDPEYRARVLAINKASRDRHKDKTAERRRIRIADDPDFHERVKLGARIRRDRDKEEINAHKRLRYANEPEFRERVLAVNRASLDRNRDARNARLRLRYATDPEFRTNQLAQNDSAKRRARYLMRTYGITLEQYDLLLKRQSRVCAICKRKPKAMLCVDHCHKKGRVRGLLCHQCNFALGLLRDDQRLTMAATAYLRRKTLPGRGPPIRRKRRKNSKARLAARTPLTGRKTKARPAAPRQRATKAATSARFAPASGTAGGSRRAPPARR